MISRVVFCSVVLAGGLVGCAPKYKDITTPLVEPRYSSPKAKESASRMVVVEARARAKNEAGELEEVSNIPCSVKGNGFAATFTTPANVQLPINGMHSSDVTYECRYKGTLRTVRGTVINHTQQRLLASGSSGGLLGVLVVGVVASARGNQQDDDYGYILPIINLEGEDR